MFEPTLDFYAVLLDSGVSNTFNLKSTMAIIDAIDKREKMITVTDTSDAEVTLIVNKICAIRHMTPSVRQNDRNLTMMVHKEQLG